MPFNIGPGELILILIIALVVLGPGRLPDAASALGRSLREFRKAASDVSDATRVDTPAPRAESAPPPPVASAPPTPAAPPADSNEQAPPPPGGGSASSETTGASEPAAVGGESTTDSRAS